MVALEPSEIIVTATKKQHIRSDASDGLRVARLNARTERHKADMELLKTIANNPAVQIAAWYLLMVSLNNKELTGSYNPFNISSGGTLLDRVQTSAITTAGMAAIAVSHMSSNQLASIGSGLSGIIGKVAGKL